MFLRLHLTQLHTLATLLMGDRGLDFSPLLYLPIEMLSGIRQIFEPIFHLYLDYYWFIF
jgi:hypothetical protein